MGGRGIDPIGYHGRPCGHELLEWMGTGRAGGVGLRGNDLL